MKPWLVVLILVGGIVVGVTATIYGPRLVAPVLPERLRPEALRQKAESVEGEVIRKQRDQDRLLLTVQTSHGTLLGIFKQKIAEIDLLVQQGDSITLALRRYEPFVEDPPIQRVRKQEPAARPKRGDPSPPAPAEEPPKEKTPEKTSSPTSRALPTRSGMTRSGLRTLPI